MITNSVDDDAMVALLLNQIEGRIKKIAADGAYDKKKVYRELSKRKIQPVIPPCKRGKITKHGNSCGKELPRDKTIRQIKKMGRNKWKKKAGYHRRSIAESAMYRFKSIFGERLSCREMLQQEVEVKIRCYALNKMAELGMPKTIKVKTAA